MTHEFRYNPKTGEWATFANIVSETKTPSRNAIGHGFFQEGFKITDLNSVNRDNVVFYKVFISFFFFIFLFVVKSNFCVGLFFFIVGYRTF